LRIAGALADGWNTAYIGAAEYRELNGVLDDWSAKADRDPADIARSINLNFNLTEQDPRTALAELEARWGDQAARAPRRLAARTPSRRRRADRAVRRGRRHARQRGHPPTLGPRSAQRLRAGGAPRDASGVGTGTNRDGLTGASRP
jgi:alkanesulfonate monooxygenase SsuD/methylene tetrahydromethanopterin reductase-like flavin-dependent oxidoreductase (luciferase family)